MKARVWIILLFLLSCESKKENGTLSWILTSGGLQTSSIMEGVNEHCKLNCIQLDFKLVNTSSENILLYNFNRFFEFAEFNDKLFCDTIFLSATRFIYIYEENGEQVKPLGRIPDSINWKPMTVLERQFMQEKNWFRNSKQIVNKGETLEFSQKINLRDFNLVFPGKYKLKLLYYQHDVLREISQKQLEQDIKSFDAFLYTGCLISNVVDLIVE